MPSKPKPPVFHIPVGRVRQNGKVVLFESKADGEDAIEAWHEMTLHHPATQAAGGCVIIGPTTTSFCDLRSKTMLQSRTADGVWEPSALSDWA